MAAFYDRQRAIRVERDRLAGGRAAHLRWSWEVNSLLDTNGTSSEHSWRCWLELEDGAILGEAYGNSGAAAVDALIGELRRRER